MQLYHVSTCFIYKSELLIFTPPVFSLSVLDSLFESLCVYMCACVCVCLRHSVNPWVVSQLASLHSKSQPGFLTSSPVCLGESLTHTRITEHSSATILTMCVHMPSCVSLYVSLTLPLYVQVLPTALVKT